MNFFRSLWDKLVEKYIDFVGLNPSDVYRATAEEYEHIFQPINCRCSVEPIKEENMLSLKYDNGKLYFGFDTYHCDDSTDMELLCNKVNKILMETIVEKERAVSKLSIIEDVIEND